MTPSVFFLKTVSLVEYGIDILNRLDIKTVAEVDLNDKLALRQIFPVRFGSPFVREAASGHFHFGVLSQYHTASIVRSPHAQR